MKQPRNNLTCGWLFGLIMTRCRLIFHLVLVAQFVITASLPVWSLSDATIPYYWNSIASDVSGQYLAATGTGTVAGVSGIFVSHDYGLLWTQTSAPSDTSYMSIASDNTGKYLAAVVGEGGIFTSSNNGTTWVKTSAPSLYWYSVASDESGNYLAAVVTAGGGIYTSRNYGLTWKVTTAPLATWMSITSDDSGLNLAAVVAGGGIYYSHNNGSTWTQSTVASGNWQVITSSSSGMYLAAGQNPGFIYYSHDFGASWATTYQLNGNIHAVASDSTGQNMVAALYGGGIYSSTDYAHTWTLQTSAPTSAAWKAISSDSSGLYLTAAVSLGGIYTTDDLGTSYYPSSQPSSQPTNPTSFPSSQPSHQPSSQPSRQPTGHPSRQPTTKPSHQPISRPSTQPTTSPSAQPSRQPTCAPSLQPQAAPTAQPSGQPTSCPSSQPQGYPSAQPSHQPTSYPSVVPGTLESTIHIVSLATSYNHTIPNLGHHVVTFVTVNILLSYLSDASGGFVTVTASACAPPTACSTDQQLASTYCAVNVDVTSAVSSEQGGMLLLTAIANSQQITGETPQPCNREGESGIYFEFNYTVSAFRQPTMQPSLKPTTASQSVVIVNSNGLVTSGGAPFYVIGFVAAAFAALGVILVRLHDSNEKVVQLKLLSVCPDLALLGNTIITEIFYIIVLFQADNQEFESLAIILIVVRLFNAVAASVLLYNLFEPSSPYYCLLDKELLIGQAKLYSLLQVIMFFDVSLFKYFPWLATSSTTKAMGFPGLYSFKLAMFTKVLHFGVALIVQSIVLQHLNESNINNADTQGLLILNMVVTILVFLSVCTTVFLLLQELNRKPATESNFGNVENPISGNNVELATIRNHTVATGIEEGTSSSAHWEQQVSLLSARVADLEKVLADRDEHLRDFVRDYVETRLTNV